MRTIQCFGVGLLLVAAANGICLGQDQAAPAMTKYYRLDFSLRELEGSSVVNSRSYTTLLGAETGQPNASIRAGSRLPFATPPGAPVQYFDVGANIDARLLKESPTQISLAITADVSTVLAPSEGPQTLPPVIRQFKWSSPVLVNLKAPTLIFSSDDAGSKRKLQLELTATPLK